MSSKELKAFDSPRSIDNSCEGDLGWVILYYRKTEGGLIQSHESAGKFGLVRVTDLKPYQYLSTVSLFLNPIAFNRLYKVRLSAQAF